jgi:hypothetical protein
MWCKSLLLTFFRHGIIVSFLATKLFGWDSQTPADATYIVKKGDTLWDIAYTLWGDSFQWPKLWNANPAITNPDLIYPGNILNIPDRFASSGDTDNTTALSSELSGFSSTNDSLANLFNESISDSTLNADLASNSKLDQSFFAKIPFLWFEQDPQGNIFPGKGIIRKPPNASYQRFDKMIIQPLAENYFSVGDTLDIYSSLRFVEIGEQTANLIKRSGRCIVLETAPQKVSAALFDQWDVITGSERVDKSVKYLQGALDTITTPSISVNGSILTRAEQTPSPYPYQTVIIDKGENDGVQMGDIFGLYSTTKNIITWKLSAVGLSLYVNKTTSSVLLVSLIHNELSDGDKAVLVRKAHFLDKENF